MIYPTWEFSFKWVAEAKQSTIRCNSKDGKQKESHGIDKS